MYENPGGPRFPSAADALGEEISMVRTPDKPTFKKRIPDKK